MENSYRNDFVDHRESKGPRMARAVVFSSWLYSLLFLIYIGFRLMLNPTIVHLDDLVIDYVPFFTFFRAGVLLIGFNLASIVLYAAIRYFSSKQGPKAINNYQEFRQSRSMGPNGVEYGYVPKIQPKSDMLTILGIFAFFTWLFSTSIWIYNCYQVLSDPTGYWTIFHPPGVLGWHLAIFMFGVSYISMIILYYGVSSHRNILPVRN